MSHPVANFTLAEVNDTAGSKGLQVPLQSFECKCLEGQRALFDKRLNLPRLLQLIRSHLCCRLFIQDVNVLVVRHRSAWLSCP